MISDGKSLAALSAANPRQEISWKQPWSVQCYADKINHIRIDLLMVEKSTLDAGTPLPRRLLVMAQLRRP